MLSAKKKCGTSLHVSNKISQSFLSARRARSSIYKNLSQALHKRVVRIVSILGYNLFVPGKVPGRRISNMLHRDSHEAIAIYKQQVLD